MSNFAGRNKTALMVIDVQNAVFGWAWRKDEVIANINKLIADARSAGTQVIWVQHSDEEMPIGSEDWALMENLTKPAAGEPVIQKNFRSSFENTNLDDVLAELGISHLVMTGGETNNCIRHTSHAAIERGYDVTLVSDAHTTVDGAWGVEKLSAENIVAEQNGSFSQYQLPGRWSKVETTAEVSF
jgi:nicotinamidase-related amidase